jgi:gentisate 1,2-dioxygenase
MHLFHDRTGAAAPPLEYWDPIVIPKADLAAEVDRLAALPAPADGRRRSLVVHPQATAPGLGLAPGITVALEVLRPGERTAPIRHNSSAVCFTIRGSGRTTVSGRMIEAGLHDVSSLPSMAVHEHENRGDDLWVRLVYSNAALLEKLGVHWVDESPGAAEAGGAPTGEVPVTTAVPLDETLPGTGDGGRLMSYERLIDPPVVESRALHWPWPMVKAEVDRLHALGDEYRGRRLYLLFNPATGRTNGTTMNFFATMCMRPANIVDRPHRHIAAAINYYFAGSGHSIVAGRRYEWSAGDLMLSAPGWAIHHHASHDEPVYELTIQDSPLHLAMDSLLWQEDLKRPERLLGSQAGFATNRDVLLEVR